MQNKIFSICLFECGLPHSGFLVWKLQIHNGFHFLQKEASLMRCGIYTHLWVYDLLRHGQLVSFKIRIPSYGAGIQSHYSPIGYPQGKIHTAVSLMEVLLGCSSLWAQASQLGNVANCFFPKQFAACLPPLNTVRADPLGGGFQVNSRLILSSLLQQSSTSKFWEANKGINFCRMCGHYLEIKIQLLFYCTAKKVFLNVISKCR